jgi:Ni/Fe-hydrogenase subunit HybB-like protein
LVASWVLGYFIIKVTGIAQTDAWTYLGTGYGLWFLVELLGFVLLPCYFFAIGAREKNLTIVRRTAVWAVLGIVLNRFNVGLIAFNYHLPSSERYFPHWMEIGISVFVVTIGVAPFIVPCRSLCCIWNDALKQYQVPKYLK